LVGFLTIFFSFQMTIGSASVVKQMNSIGYLMNRRKRINTHVKDRITYFRRLCVLLPSYVSLSFGLEKKKKKRNPMNN